MMDNILKTPNPAGFEGSQLVWSFITQTTAGEDDSAGELAFAMMEFLTSLQQTRTDVSKELNFHSPEPRPRTSCTLP